MDVGGLFFGVSCNNNVFTKLYYRIKVAGEYHIGLGVAPDAVIEASESNDWSRGILVIHCPYGEGMPSLRDSISGNGEPRTVSSLVHLA